MMNDKHASYTLNWNEQGLPLSRHFNDIYFSLDNGLEESEHVFIQGNAIKERLIDLKSDRFTIAETGFGTGLNFLAIWRLLNAINHQRPNNPIKIHFISFECYPLTVDELIKAHLLWPELERLATMLHEHWPKNLTHRDKIEIKCSPFMSLTLWIGDVNNIIIHEHPQYSIDAWFLDGFAPAKNPEMWTKTLYQYMADTAHPKTTFATFTAAGHVKRGLIDVGFNVKKLKGFGKKREMLAGVYCFS